MEDDCAGTCEMLLVSCHDREAVFKTRAANQAIGGIEGRTLQLALTFQLARAIGDRIGDWKNAVAEPG